MGSLVHLITDITAASYGVSILEIAPLGGVKGVGTNVVAVIADLPWGPVDTITEITSNAELFETFCPLPFNALDTYGALKAFINKTFPNTVKVVRISPTAQATATKTFNDAAGTPAASTIVTAKSPGLLGNSLKVAWSVNADDATARDATVSISTAYSVLYRAVATIVSAALVVTDPGDPYVTFTKHGSGTLVPAAVAATALATGLDGTAVAGEYVSAIELFSDASVKFDVGFVAEPASGVINAVNAGIKAFVDAYHKGFWVLCTVASQSVTAAKTYRATYASDRAFYPWPLVKTTNTFDPNRAEVTVNGNAFAACTIANVVPEKSPGGAPGAKFLRGITGLEQGATLIQLNDLNDNGVTPFFYSDALEGFILHNAVTTSLVSGLTKVFRRRMTDFLVQSIAGFLERFVGELLDLDLAHQTLGPVTGPEIATVRNFLEGLKSSATPRIRDYSVDEFGGNTQANIDAGQWIIILVVQLFSAQEEIILQAQIGETVTVTAA